MNMFWKRILTSVMFAVGVALVFRSLLNLIPALRHKKKRHDKDGPGEDDE